MILSKCKEHREALKEIKEREMFARRVIEEVYSSRYDEIKRQTDSLSDFFDQASPDDIENKMSEMTELFRKSPDEEISARLDEYNLETVSGYKE